MEPNDSNNLFFSDVDKLDLMVRRIKNGDDNAFREFFFLMQPGIYRYLYRYLCDQNSAEDLTQETFVKFWIHRKQLDPSFSPKSYLYRIARNLALNYIKRNHPISQSRLSKVDYFTAFLNPEDNYDQSFFLDEFQRAVSDLPERCRATFILCKYEGFKYSEIADILDVSLQTVKNQMNKAISVLKKLLSSHLS